MVFKSAEGQQRRGNQAVGARASKAATRPTIKSEERSGAPRSMKPTLSLLAQSKSSSIPQSPSSQKAAADTASSFDTPEHDPIYRIMHAMPRSDMLEVVKCKFMTPHCQRAARYFDEAFMQNPLRKLRLQIGCDGPTGLYFFFPKIAFHRFALRTLDLSRNRLTAADVATLCDLLELSGPRGRSHSSGLAGCDAKSGEGDSSGPAGCSALTSSGSSVSERYATSCMELLDLSYNPSIGNVGAIHLLRSLRSNSTIRAVILKGVAIDDAGASPISELLRQRPAPASISAEAAVRMQMDASQRRENGFFLNLNENSIGAVGTSVLGKGLPHYVSLTLAKQHIKKSP